MLAKKYLIVIGIFAALFCYLYFGLDTKPKSHELVEKSRVLNLESTNISNLLIDAKNTLSAADQDIIHALELQVKATENDSTKAIALENLSAKWFEAGHEAISGFYAEEIANIRNDEDAWSIAGTTYTLCLRSAKTDKVKQYCSKNGVKAFENAISLNPDNLAHKINLAVNLAEFPPEENPMQGIMQLLSLNREHPDNTSVLYQLARFGMQTGQYDKAIGRLEKMLELSPEDPRAICLLSRIYENMGNSQLASLYGEKCMELN